MNIRTMMCSVLMLGFLSAPVAYAEPTTNVQIEVNFLLGYVDGSSCEFYRNGIWHDAKAAQEHLRDKYKYLVARNLITVTEDFIERGATESSLTGIAYQVRCNGGAPISSNKWLRDELVRFRTF